MLKGESMEWGIKELTNWVYSFGRVVQLVLLLMEIPLLLVGINLIVSGYEEAKQKKKYAGLKFFSGILVVIFTIIAMLYTL
jgi:hypothetical protein